MNCGATRPATSWCSSAASARSAKPPNRCASTIRTAARSCRCIRAWRRKNSSACSGPSGRRRIVLATNVAETSLTVPGIRAVIDTGVARISRYSHRSRLQRLPIEKISQASARTSAPGAAAAWGRASRSGCIPKRTTLARPAFTEPEIQRTNLAAVILQMHALKLGDIEAFPFVEPPDGRYMRDGQRTLREIDALTEEGQLTEMGRRLARLPLDPRLGRILLAGVDEKCLEEVAIIAAALSVPDPRDRPADKQTQADQKHALLRDEQSDFLSLLKLWRAWAEQREQLSRAKLRGWCRENFLSYLRLTEWHDVHGQVHGGGEGRARAEAQRPARPVRSHPPGTARRSAFAGGAAQGAGRVPGRQRHQAAHPSGLGAVQGEAAVDRLQRAGARPPRSMRAMWRASTRAGWKQVGEHLVRRQHYDPHWERRAARAAVHERTTLFGLTLTSDRRVPFERIDPKAARELFIRHALVRMEYDSRAPFLTHNLKLLEEAEYLQQKGRRVDLLVRRRAGCMNSSMRASRRASPPAPRSNAGGGRPKRRSRSCCGSPSRTSPPAMPSSMPTVSGSPLCRPAGGAAHLPLRARP